LSSVVPSTLTDFQAILDNDFAMNDIYPSIGLIGTDNFKVSDAKIGTLSQTEANAYLWAAEVFNGAPSNDWNSAYQVVEYSNIVLDGLKNINTNASNIDQYNNILGSALFYRAFAVYTLSQIFCKPYIPATAATDLGIPIRMSSDVNKVSTRSTVKECYAQIVQDLVNADAVLPMRALYITRPSKIAVNGLLAKVYLSMQDYGNALTYSNNALSQYDSLVDYNSNVVNKTSTFRFPGLVGGKAFPEVIFFAMGFNYASLRPGSIGKGLVDSSLYTLYDNNDLRKVVFFNNKGAGNILIAGSYTGTAATFGGIANNELYLIRAESYAQTGNLSLALQDLNTLIRKRYKTGTFIPITATSNVDGLSKILLERRKELPFTGQLRWEDLRRLNQIPAQSQTLTRTSKGVVYTLTPNDIKYVYPIPNNEVQTSGIQQNPRQ